MLIKDERWNSHFVFYLLFGYVPVSYSDASDTFQQFVV